MKFKGALGKLIQAKGRVVPFIGSNFIWILVLVVGIGAGIANPVFWAPSNLVNILNANAYLGCLVVGVSFVLLTGNIDVSFESNLILSGVVGGILMMPPKVGGEVTGGFGLPWPLALAAMLATSSLVGLVNGLLTVKCRLNSLMVTIAMMTGLIGLAMLVAKGRRILQLPEGFQYIGGADIGPISVSVFFMAVVFVIVGIVLTRTIFGSNIYAVGGNRRAARAAGVDDDRIVIKAFVLCGLFAGLSAFVLMGRLGCASLSMSSGALFQAIAAAVIGGVSIYGGRGHIGGIVGGLLLIGIITNAMNMAGVGFEYIKIATGLVILGALLIDSFRRRRLRSE